MRERNNYIRSLGMNGTTTKGRDETELRGKSLEPRDTKNKQIKLHQDKLCGISTTDLIVNKFQSHPNTDIRIPSNKEK